MRSKIEKGINKDRYFETFPVENVNSIDGYMHEGGKTMPYSDPTSVWVNRNSMYDPSQIFVHEKQHLLDARRGRTEPRFPAPDFKVEEASYYTNMPEKTGYSEKELKAIQDKTKQDIDNVYRKYRDSKYLLSDDFTDSGFFAELKRIESTLPKGKGIQDTDIGKELFSNNPDLLMTYWSRTRPEKTTYITEQRDLPRFTGKLTDEYKNPLKRADARNALKKNLEKVQDFIRKKTAN
jgi:hypothetical protein